MTQNAKYQGPLTGLNVVDFGHYYAGPMAAMLLADQGANVIHIVRPDSQELPTPQYRLLNRNKKLLELNLKTEKGKKQAESLVHHADVVIENFRPGVMKRLGLDYATVKNDNPGLVYLSLPGFASTDKERAHIQAWEGILGAAAGVFTLTSEARGRLGFPPVYSWVPHCSVYGAYNGVLGVMAALVAREQYYQGTILEVPLADAGLSGFVHHFWELAVPASPCPEELKFTSMDSKTKALDKLNKAHLDFWSNPYGTIYTCADGRKIFIYACYPNVSEYSRCLLKALGIDEQLKREGFVNAGIRETGLDNNLSDIPGLQPARKQRLRQLIEEVALTKTATQWEETLAAAGVAVTVIRTREEWLALEPLLRSGVFTQMNNGASTMTVPGRIADISSPFHDKASEPEDIYREAESISFIQANDLLKQSWATQEPVNISPQPPAPLKKGDLLQGLKVLDLANMLAGPFAGQFLAEYGAEIIKVDPPKCPCFSTLLTGKRSILTDIKTAPGREVFERLVSWADVVTHNILDDTARRMGTTHAALKAINPNVVSCQVSAFSGTQRGGWENRSGYDPIAQSASGMMAQYGTLDIPLDHGTIACGDIAGGLNLAFTALLCIYQQRKTGYGGEGRTSLARMANYYQLPYMIADENGHSDWGEAHGQFALGEHQWQRLYACRDGWIYLDTGKDRADVLLETVVGSQDADEHALEVAFAGQDCDYWLAKLSAAEIACHPVLNKKAIVERYTCQGNHKQADKTAQSSSEIQRYNDPATGTPFTRFAPNYVRVGEDHTWKQLYSPPQPGQHTREILKNLGYQDTDIEEFIRLKVCYETLPEILNYAI